MAQCGFCTPSCWEGKESSHAREPLQFRDCDQLSEVLMQLVKDLHRRFQLRLKLLLIMELEQAQLFVARALLLELWLMSHFSFCDGSVPAVPARCPQTVH